MSKPIVKLVFARPTDQSTANRAFLHKEIIEPLKKEVAKGNMVTIIYPVAYQMDLSKSIDYDEFSQAKRPGDSENQAYKEYCLKARKQSVVKLLEGMMEKKEWLKTLKDFGTGWYAEYNEVLKPIFKTGIVYPCTYDRERALGQLFSNPWGFEPELIGITKQNPDKVKFLLEPPNAEADYAATYMELLGRLIPRNGYDEGIGGYARKYFHAYLQSIFLRNKALVSFVGTLDDQKTIIIPRELHSKKMGRFFDKGNFDIEGKAYEPQQGILNTAAAEYHENNGTMEKVRLGKYSLMYLTAWRKILELKGEKAIVWDITERRPWPEHMYLFYDNYVKAGLNHAIITHPQIAKELNLQ